MEYIRKVDRAHVFVGVIVALGLLDTISKLIVMVRADLFIPANWSDLALAIFVGAVFFA